MAISFRYAELELSIYSCYILKTRAVDRNDGDNTQVEVVAVSRLDAIPNTEEVKRARRPGDEEYTSRASTLTI
jgi:hypothetical protein